MPGEKILVVEDEKSLVKILKYNLEKEGYRVTAAYDGEAAILAARRERPDLIVLDLMLPKKDGFEVLKAVRAAGPIPVVVLTAKSGEVDRVLGLEMGADDYVVKPFSVREIAARIKAILRRSSGAAPSKPAVLRAGSIELDCGTYEVRVKGRPAALSSKEFEFLKCLLEARGQALSREEILEKIWGYDRAMDIDTRTIDQHIARLRDKLGSEAGRIVTVKNVGYRLKTE